MKNKRWTNKEREYIKNNFGKMKVDDIAKKLQRTTTSVNQQAYLMRKGGRDVAKAQNYKSWTKEEEEKLKELYKTLIPPQIAKILGRTPGSIYTKIASMEERARVRDKKRFETAKAKKQFEIDAYNKLINEPVVGGVRKSDIKVEMGKSYEVERTTARIFKEDWKKYQGKVIQETKDHFTLKNKVRSETFLKVDFLIGEYKIKEVS